MSSRSYNNVSQEKPPFRRTNVKNSCVLSLCLAVCLLASSHVPQSSVDAFSPSVRIHSPRLQQYQKNIMTTSRRKRLPLSSSPLILMGTAAATAARDAEYSDDGDYCAMDEVNTIQPKTKTLLKSMNFYTRYVLYRIQENRAAKKLQTQKEKKNTWRDTFRTLNEQRKNIVRLAGYNGGIVVPSFAFLLLGALMMSIIPHFYSQCITCVASNEASTVRVFQALSGLAITSTLGALFTGMRGSLFWIAGSRANYNVRVKLHRNLLLQEAAFFDSNEVGYLLSRLNNDVNKIGAVISFHVNVVLRQFAQFLFGSIYLIKISPMLSMYAFSGIGLVAWVSAIYGAFSRHLAEKVQDTFADATAVAETSFTMSETIRAFDGVTAETTKYEGAQSRALELEEVQAWAYGTHKFVSDTLQAALQCAMLFACWTIGRAGGLPASKLTTFLFYTNFVLESSNEVGDQWAKIQSAVGASSSVFDLIRRIPSIRDPPAVKGVGYKVPASGNDAVDDKKTFHGKLYKNLALPDDPSEPIIHISNMTVTYGAMEKPALDGIDLDIYPGDRVAIVGRSGSGKSSMLRSILRFYDPSSGNLDLNGKSLKEQTRKKISTKIAPVEQEPHLFPMSIMENVLYGINKDSVNSTTGEPCYSEEYREAVSDALHLAGLSVRPGNSLGLELDTRVGEGGRTLSGGQRQRVAIARALIRSPEVLLLDEPTAALDSQSETTVVAALQTAMEHTKSMVMVTHRLGIVRKLNVNKVIVLEKGRIAEMGHPEDLLQKENGLYARLAREQGITAVPVFQ